MLKNIPIISLIASNFIPLIGVLFFNWDLFSIFFLYWLETAVIGIYNIPKIIKASGPDPNQHSIKSPKVIDMVIARLDTKKGIGRILSMPISELFSVIPFFLIYFGGYMFFHLLIIIFAFDQQVRLPVFYSIAYISFLISHGLSYKYSFIDKHEYASISKIEQMTTPFKRVWFMHIILIIGIKLLERFAAPTLLLVVMIILKIILDIDAHYREHNIKSRISGSIT